MQKELSEMSLEELWMLFPIILTEHRNEWSEWYLEEKENLRKVLLDIDVIRVSHIGSTAIHAICVKPTVDILLEIRNKCDLNTVKTLLQNNGYACMFESETRIALNKGYTKYGFSDRVFHLHLRLAGDNDELYFRDFMNDNDQAAKEYEKLKLMLWKQYEHDRDGYTEAKTDFVKKYTKEAKILYADRYK